MVRDCHSAHQRLPRGEAVRGHTVRCPAFAPRRMKSSPPLGAAPPGLLSTLRPWLRGSASDVAKGTFHAGPPSPTFHPLHIALAPSEREELIIIQQKYANTTTHASLVWVLESRGGTADGRLYGPPYNTRKPPSLVFDRPLEPWSFRVGTKTASLIPLIPTRSSPNVALGAASR